MARMSKVIESRRLAVFEALALHNDTGLTQPAIIKSSGVPRSTVPRIVKRFHKLGVIRKMGRVGKADVYRLNLANKDVKRMTKTLLNYSVEAIRDDLPQKSIVAAPAPRVDVARVAHTTSLVPLDAVEAEAYQAVAKVPAAATRGFVVYSDGPFKRLIVASKGSGKSANIVKVDLDLTEFSVGNMPPAAGAA